jgi:hypothetical protein
VWRDFPSHFPDLCCVFVMPCRADFYLYVSVWLMLMMMIFFFLGKNFPMDFWDFQLIFWLWENLNLFASFI